MKMRQTNLIIGVEERDELIASFEKQVFDFILSDNGKEDIKQYIKNSRCDVSHAFDHRNDNVAELDFRLLSENKDDLLDRLVIIIHFIPVINTTSGNLKWEVKDGEYFAIDVANDLVKHISNIVSKPGEISPSLEIPPIQEEATTTVDPFLPEKKEETGFFNVRYLHSYVDKVKLCSEYSTLQDAYLDMIKKSYYREISHLVNIHAITSKLYAHDWVPKCDINIPILTRLDKTTMMRLDVKYQVIDEDGLPKLIAEFKGNLGIIASDGHVEINDTVISGSLVSFISKIKAEIDSLLK